MSMRHLWDRLIKRFAEPQVTAAYYRGRAEGEELMKLSVHRSLRPVLLKRGEEVFQVLTHHRQPTTLSRTHDVQGYIIPEPDYICLSLYLGGDTDPIGFNHIMIHGLPVVSRETRDGDYNYHQHTRMTGGGGR